MKTQFFLKGQKQLVVRATFIQEVAGADARQKHTMSPPEMASQQAGPGLGLQNTGAGCALSWRCPFAAPQAWSRRELLLQVPRFVLLRFLGKFCLSSCQMKTLEALFCFCKSRSIRHRLVETKAVVWQSRTAGLVFRNLREMNFISLICSSLLIFLCSHALMSGGLRTRQIIYSMQYFPVLLFTSLHPPWQNCFPLVLLHF